jgi:Spy/CpxP family protein refolding chaperone
MNRTVIVLLVLLLGTGSYLDGQARPSGSSGRDPGPINMLLSLREELSLTPAQIARLESVDERMEQQNQPLVTRMSEIRQLLRRLGDRDTMTPGERVLWQQYIQEARPLMRSIEKNNEAAMEEVGEILTPAQKAEIGRRIRERTQADRDRSSNSTQRPSRAY